MPGIRRQGRSETKKQQVLQVAQQDPFLTVAEIAAVVSTTPKYVRTILSEAGISLAALRKTYAKHVRATDSGGTKTVCDGFHPALALQLQGEHVKHGTIVFHRRLDQLIASRLQTDSETALLSVERWAFVGEEPLFLNRLMTPYHVTLNPHEVESGQPLRRALSFGEGRAQCRPPILELCQADSDLAASFGIEPGKSLLQWSHVIVVAEKAVAWEAFIFAPDRVQLMLPAQAAGEVRLVVREDDRVTAAIS